MAVLQATVRYKNCAHHSGPISQYDTYTLPVSSVLETKRCIHRSSTNSLIAPVRSSTPDKFALPTDPSILGPPTSLKHMQLAFSCCTPFVGLLWSLLSIDAKHWLTQFQSLHDKYTTALQKAKRYILLCCCFRVLAFFRAIFDATNKTAKQLTEERKRYTTQEENELSLGCDTAKTNSTQGKQRATRGSQESFSSAQLAQKFQVRYTNLTPSTRLPSGSIPFEENT
ncbi:hypothetical protein Tcan_09953 [Toxocara canis]|uniref:Uncharacterized protein n=1 Tax=Toxocara canis TaxID=6265 RepID=A0A0B2V4J6_TOXCA|nr:hypothetical protein Tcan_09953 [Toxocara canis]